MRDRAEIIAAERELLRFFCQQASRLPQNDLVWQKADQYPWHEPEHLTLYNSVSSLRPASASQLRERLPTRLTLSGFPDLEWEELFEGSDVTEAQALQILSDLGEG